MDSTLIWTILLLQIAMGGFDTVFHHEFTEKLAWRPSQKQELRLHGWRNLLYAVFFFIMGFTEVHGGLAVFLIIVLGIEMVITLVDFVEEDRSRRLPWTERVLHTLLTLNYGVLLALLVPVLLGWAQQPTGLVWAFHGVFSLLMIPAVAGVIFCGLKDLAAARRLSRMKERPLPDLVTGLKGRQRILVTGGTGFIGARLVPALIAGGHDVTLLVRNPQKAAVTGTPLRLVTSLDQIADTDSFDAIINLAGAPIVGGLWTRQFRRKVLFSRLRVTAAVNRLIGRLEKKPAVLVNASAIGIYGITDDTPQTEETVIRPDGSFSNRLCASWEKAASKAAGYGVRVVRLRIGLVLDTSGGMLANLLFPFEFFMGGPFGNGQQWMSWISRDDTVRMIAHAIARDEIEGPLNVVAPAPVRNAGFALALGSALGRPAAIPLPGFVLRLLGDLGEEIFLGGQLVLPTRALQTGFMFLDPDLAPCLNRLTGRAETEPRHQPDMVTPVQVT